PAVGPVLRTVTELTGVCHNCVRNLEVDFAHRKERDVQWIRHCCPSRSMEGSDMLVLSRKLGEKIYIGENICITVVDIDRGKIRLGIEAPRDVPIYRQELLPLNNQQQQQQQPAQPKPDTPVTLT